MWRGPGEREHAVCQTVMRVISSAPLSHPSCLHVGKLRVTEGRSHCWSEVELGSPDPQPRPPQTPARAWTHEAASAPAQHLDPPFPGARFPARKTWTGSPQPQVLASGPSQQHPCLNQREKTWGLVIVFHQVSLRCKFVQFTKKAIWRHFRP